MLLRKLPYANILDDIINDQTGERILDFKSLHREHYQHFANDWAPIDINIGLRIFIYIIIICTPSITINLYG